MTKEVGQSERETAWSIYSRAKRTALAAPVPEQEASPGGMSLEELEAAIAAAAATSGIPETGLPPRSIVHPNPAGKAAKWFYRTLLALFSVLVAGLLWWGNKKYGSG